MTREGSHAITSARDRRTGEGEERQHPAGEGDQSRASDERLGCAGEHDEDEDEDEPENQAADD
jgi:hypothetical protein